MITNRNQACIEKMSDCEVQEESDDSIFWLSLQPSPKKKLDKIDGLCIIDSIYIKGGCLTNGNEEVNFYLADLQIKRLKAINKKTGLPLSDILRRAIDEYWERHEKKAKK